MIIQSRINVSQCCGPVPSKCGPFRQSSAFSSTTLRLYLTAYTIVHCMSARRRRNKQRSATSLDSLPFPTAESPQCPPLRAHITSTPTSNTQRPLLAKLRGRSISALNVNQDILHRFPETVPLAYASLPPTPISRSASPSFETPPTSRNPPPFSLWDYLREELLATDFDSHQELKWDRVSNFLSMPLAMEKVISISFTQLKLHIPTILSPRSSVLVSYYVSTRFCIHSLFSLSVPFLHSSDSVTTLSAPPPLFSQPHRRPTFYAFSFWFSLPSYCGLLPTRAKYIILSEDKIPSNST